MRKAWGTGKVFAGQLSGTLLRITENGPWLGFTVDDNGSPKTVMLSREQAPNIFITETSVTITEAQTDA